MKSKCENFHLDRDLKNHWDFDAMLMKFSCGDIFFLNQDARERTQRNATQRNATQRNATQRNATQRNATQQKNERVVSDALGDEGENWLIFWHFQFLPKSGGRIVRKNNGKTTTSTSKKTRILLSCWTPSRTTKITPKEGKKKNNARSARSARSEQGGLGALPQRL